MTEIHGDREFKAILDGLPLAKQRSIGALFIGRVLDLTDDVRIKNAVAIARRLDSSPDELKDTYPIIKGIAVETYNTCAKEADWLCQAKHFVAEAGAVCLTPGERQTQCKNLAWNVAMNVRLARNCESIAHGEGKEHKEAQEQYKILQQFLESG